MSEGQLLTIRKTNLKKKTFSDSMALEYSDKYDVTLGLMISGSFTHCRWKQMAYLKYWKIMSKKQVLFVTMFV